MGGQADAPVNIEAGTSLPYPTRTTSAGIPSGEGPTYRNRDQNGNVQESYCECETAQMQ